MTPAINNLIAREHVADLRRVAEQSNARATDSGVEQARAVELRLAAPHEAHLVGRLAALDDAAELEGPTLIAVVDGTAVAAMSLADGRVVANPFLLTSEAVALLRLRAAHLSPTRQRSRRLRLASRRAGAIVPCE
jgi:hypothetical protein